MAEPLEGQLQKLLKKLHSRQASVRLDAARKIGRLSRGNWTAERSDCLTDSSVTESILLAAKGSDPKVQVEAINALGMISQRYKHRDLRIRDALLEEYQGADSAVRLQIAQAIPYFGSRQVWEVVVSAIECKPKSKAQWTVGLALCRYGGNIRSKVLRQQCCDLMVKELKCPANGDSADVMIDAVVTLTGKGAEWQDDAVSKKIAKEIRLREGSRD